MHSPEAPRHRACLVGVRLPDITEQECEDSLAELERLVHTLGHDTAFRLVQARPSLTGATVLGAGKLRELARLTGGKGEVTSRAKHKVTRLQIREQKAAEKAEREAAEAEEELPDEDVEEGGEEIEELPPLPEDERAKLVIFDCELTPSQLQRLESALGCEVLDRSAVIIQIFSRHARTRAAKLQVELARLAYLSPRLRETGGGGDRQAGGIGGKGAGESKLELDRRKIRDRIKELRDELELVAGEDGRRRERRAQERTVALVGYTNAGKSSMMRALTGSEVLVQDKLFATLDTTVRPLYPEATPRILVSDTVGFIQKLPHDLVASFRSTLEEALHASLLIFVVDASDRAFRHQLEVTRTVLAEVGATDIPSLLVLNKADRLDDDRKKALAREFPDAVCLSVLDPADVARLREHICRFFERDMVERHVFIPYTAQGSIGSIRAAMRVLNEEYGGDGVTLVVRASPDTFDRVARKLPAGVRVTS